MQSLKYLLTKIIIAIPFIIALGIIYIIFFKFVPSVFNFSFSFGFTTNTVDNFLPDPKNIKPFVSSVIKDEDVKINGTIVGINKNRSPIGDTYVTTDKKGNLIYFQLNKQSVEPQEVTFNPIKKNYNDSDYVRSLSIFSGGHIYTGMKFTGQAKNTMFKDGLFQVMVIDKFGRIIDVENVLANNDWAFPGWSRFNVKINGVLPVATPCALIFKPAVGSPDSYKGIYVQVPEICN